MLNRQQVDREENDLCFDNAGLRNQNAILSLKSVAEINEKMKQIVNASNRLYVISLNAMFASRSIGNGVKGFIEVTALLRDFSNRLDTQVGEISSEINNLVFQSASLTKKRRLNQLIRKALTLSSNFESSKQLKDQSLEFDQTLEDLTESFSRQLSRCEFLMKIGENLVVLAKVESVSAEGADLTPITDAMNATIISISEDLAKSQAILVN